MTQADVQGVCGRISIHTVGSGLVFEAVLHVGSHCVHIGALAERIVVADAHNITREVILRALVSALSDCSASV